MADFLDDVVSRLVAAGIGTFGTNIFSGSKSVVPTGNGPYATLTETGGTGPTRIQNQSNAATQRPSAQILWRASTYKAARDKASASYVALDGIFNTTINGTKYVSITARQEPTDIGLDDTARPMIAFNIDAERIPS